ncbi:MAG: hypothetical protein GY749_09260 [Desulfobacteraceae bacterium]|nr:hypothetical protein [Desulfobacteraceae bacterium]
MKKEVLFSKRSFFSTLCAVVFLFASAFPVYSEVIQTAVVTAAASNNSSGAHSVISVDPAGGPRNAQNELAPTLSDLSVVTYGNYFYRIGRYQMDNVTKFDINAPATPVWQFSVQGYDEQSANPQDIIFVNDNKAYLLRYGSPNAWIINPSATAEAEFKIGELDLSSYDDGDGVPEVKTGVIINGKLFILFQRWDRSSGYGNWALNEAWTAVFDIETDTEINTGKGNETMAGIPLPAMNPHSVHYLKENNTIYVQCAGEMMDPAEYTGGIISINPDTYETSMILDDGDDENHPYGNISGFSIVSPDKGYFVSYAGWKDNTLYSFNPSTGEVNGPVNDDLTGKNIAGMESGSYLDKNKMLWVCNSTDAEIIVINTADDTIDEKISTSLNPIKVAFVTVYDGQDEWVKISGRVRIGETSLCAMVLANGQHTFSCEDDGKYEMDVPLNSDGEIVLHTFADGFASYKQTLYSWEAEDFDINMSPVSDTMNMSLTTTMTTTDSGRVNISGKVKYGDTPLCAMVLANGQHMFSCGGQGEYSLNVPLNSDGEIVLFGFVEGFVPFKKILKPDDNPNIALVSEHPIDTGLIPNRILVVR